MQNGPDLPILTATDATRLIGREAPMAAAEARLRAALRGQGSLLLVSGDAGMGKTSLALTLGELARSTGAAFAVGRAYEGGIAPPFSPWVDALDDLDANGILDDSSLPPPFGQGDPARTAWQLAQSVVGLLTETSRRQPLVVLLDDLHWSDADSLELLEVATRRVERQALLYVVTYRAQDLQPSNPLFGLLPRLQRDRPAEHLTLGELSAEQIALLVEARHGACSSQLATYVHARSDGSPLFVVELMRDLVERNLLSRDGQGALLPPLMSVETPALLKQVVLERVARLGADAEALLRTAAVVGDEWELSVAESVLGWTEDRLLAAVEVALGAQVVLSTDERGEQYHFRHGLIREVLYTDQLPRRRRQVHGAVAGTLRQLADLDGTEASPTALAYHYLHAEQWEPATLACLEAGEHARKKNAIHSALAWYQAGLEASTRCLAPPDVRLTLFERLGQAFVVTNQKELAQQAFHDGLALAQGLGNRAGEARARFWISYMHRRLYQVDDSWAEADAALQGARESGDAHLLALTQWNLAHLSGLVGQLSDAHVHLEEAERLSRERGDHEVLGLTLQRRALHSVWLGDYPTGERSAREALEVSRTSRDALTVGGSYWALGMALGELGRYQEARDAIQAGIDNAHELGEYHYLVKLINTMGWLWLEAGDPTAALRWDLDALEACQRTDVDRDTEAERYSLLNLVSDQLSLGDLPAAEQYMRAFEPMLDLDEYGRFRYFNRYQLVKSELGIACGQHDVGLRWAQEALTFARNRGVRKNIAKASLLSGRAFLALGRTSDAADALEQAVAVADELSQASLTWQSRYWLGRARVHQRAAAIIEFRAAFDRVEAIAASLQDESLRRAFLGQPLVQELRGLAERGGALPQRPSWPAHLTDREVEVLKLVVQGATNAAIAETLVVSVKTVNAHLSSILGKTGCANRAAAAAFALRHGLA